MVDAVLLDEVIAQAVCIPDVGKILGKGFIVHLLHTVKDHLQVGFLDGDAESPADQAFVKGGVVKRGGAVAEQPQCAAPELLDGTVGADVGQHRLFRGLGLQSAIDGLGMIAKALQRCVVHCHRHQGVGQQSAAVDIRLPGCPEDQGQLQRLRNAGAHIVAGKRTVEHDNKVHTLGAENLNGLLDTFRRIDNMVKADNLGVTGIFPKPGTVGLVALDWQGTGPAAGYGGDKTDFHVFHNASKIYIRVYNLQYANWVASPCLHLYYSNFFCASQLLFYIFFTKRIDKTPYLGYTDLWKEKNFRNKMRFLLCW